MKKTEKSSTADKQTQSATTKQPKEEKPIRVVSETDPLLKELSELPVAVLAKLLP